jgi:Glyoxalase-like domain
MATRLTTVVFAALDPSALACFWAEALGWQLGAGELQAGEMAVRPPVAAGVELIFAPSAVPKAGKNRLHLDLAGGSSQAQVVRRLLALGASRADIGQGLVPWDVLADPEGNEFCVLADGDPGRPLAGICLDAATPEVQGRFWAAAAGWAVAASGAWGVTLRSPSGTGPDLTMGPPAAARLGRNRLCMEVAPVAGDDLDLEVNRLLAAGATPAISGQGGMRRQWLADPEGNEFSVRMA